MAPKDPLFAQAMNQVPSPFYNAPTSGSPSTTTTNPVSSTIDSTLDDDEQPDASKRLDPAAIVAATRGWADENIFDPLQRKLDTICGVDQVNTGNSRLD